MNCLLTGLSASDVMEVIKIAFIKCKFQLINSNAKVDANATSH